MENVNLFDNSSPNNPIPIQYCKSLFATIFHKALDSLAKNQILPASNLKTDQQERHQPNDIIHESPVFEAPIKSILDNAIQSLREPLIVWYSIILIKRTIRSIDFSHR
jgi:hypothetical protein